MTRSRRFVLSVAMLALSLGVAGTLLAMHASSHRTSSPYVSALARVAVATANAQSCPFQQCAIRGHKGYLCVRAATASECLLTSSTSCNTQSCVIQ